MTENKTVILAIDDDQDVLDMVRAILEANGYDMIEATSGKQGLEVYKENKPDFVIVDLMMETIDAGMNFAKAIKELGDTPPIYMLTNVGDDMAKNIDYSELGVSGVLQKPINKDSILKIIEARL